MSQIPFKISARTAGLIGKENIASAEGAIIELVKNSYDADATDCIILFDNANKNNQTLFIIDNGHGMNDTIIHDYWMTIGTSNKLHDAFSTNKRIKTGAKGIGRFALDRLGEKVKMNTLPLGKKSGFEWKVNWKEFSDNKTLDQVFASLEDVSNLDMKGTIADSLKHSHIITQHLKKTEIDSGTVFQISNLRDDWEEEDINRLLKNLEVLVPPKEISDFKITLLSSKHAKKFGTVESSIWDD